MIAVAKGLLGGLATVAGSASKKDGETAPFAETFQQIAAAREAQAAVSQRVASGGRKGEDSSVPHSGKQTVTAGSHESPSMVAMAENDGKGSQFADSANQQAGDGFESGGRTQGLVAQPTTSLPAVPGPSAVSGGLAEIPATQGIAEISAPRGMASDMLASIPKEATQPPAGEARTAANGNPVGSSVAPMVSASPSLRIVSPLATESQPADRSGDALGQVDVPVGKQHAVRQLQQKIDRSSVAVQPKVPNSSTSPAIAIAPTPNKKDVKEQGADPAPSQAVAPTAATGSVQTVPQMTDARSEASEVVASPTAPTPVLKPSSITQVTGASHRAISKKNAVSSDLTAPPAAAPALSGAQDTPTISSAPLAITPVVPNTSDNSRNGDAAKSVTSVVTGSAPGVRALTTSKQNLPPTLLPQVQGSPVDFETTKPVTDSATAALGTEDVKAGNETSLVAAAEPSGKSVPQRGAVIGNTPTAKERTVLASEQGTAATEPSAPIVPSHPGTAPALSTPVPAEHQATKAAGAEAPVIPAPAIAGATVTTEPLLAPAAHVAAGPASLTARAETVAASPALPATLTVADHGLSPLAHTTLSATPEMLEVGVPSGTQGWLKIRAEIGEGGVVQASVSASTHAGQDALTRNLPAMSAFLESEHVPVTLQITHAVSSVAAALGDATSFDSSVGSGLGQSLQQNANSSGGSAQHGPASEMAAGGSGAQGGERQKDAPGEFHAAATGAVATRDATAGLGSDWVAPAAGYGNGSLLNGGSWLNVIA